MQASRKPRSHGVPALALGCITERKCCQSHNINDILATKSRYCLNSTPAPGFLWTKHNHGVQGFNSMSNSKLVLRAMEAMMHIKGEQSISVPHFMRSGTSRGKSPTCGGTGEAALAEVLTAIAVGTETRLAPFAASNDSV